MPSVYTCISILVIRNYVNVFKRNKWMIDMLPGLMSQLHLIGLQAHGS